MASAPFSPMRRLWLKWKSLRLPWRRQILVGADLSGNTFWEFPDALHPSSMNPSFGQTAQRQRRIMRHNPRDHYADVKISPAWHQWLRRVRETAPSVEEQVAEKERLDSVKVLAAKADERWRNAPSLLEKKRSRADKPSFDSMDGIFEQAAPTTQIDQVRPEAETSEAPAESTKGKGYAVNPWSKSGGSSKEWQPETWSPGLRRR